MVLYFLNVVWCKLLHVKESVYKWRRQGAPLTQDEEHVSQLERATGVTGKLPWVATMEALGHVYDKCHKP